MSVQNWPRLIVSSLVGVGLAILVGLQSLSSVSTRTAPALAVQLFPANGLARERLVFEQFTAGISEPGDEVEAARAVVDQARKTLRSDPLAPKAIAILALAQQDDESRRGILDIGQQLNRRDLTLQGLVLQERLAEGDYPRSIETLDQILRVHPEYSQEFFPVLVSALADEETVPLFADMLDGSSPWHERFLRHAVGTREVLPQLAVLRREITIADEIFDRRLISGLATIGEIESAQEIFRFATGSDAIASGTGVIDWQSTYPPFQWRFLDEPGFRAQTSNDMEKLELSVRPGKGGVIAARLLGAPDRPFEVRIKHRISPADQLRDVRLQLICATNSEAFFDERFSRQGEGFLVNSMPSGCEHMLMAINARAWSGRSALSGTVDQIEIIAR